MRKLNSLRCAGVLVFGALGLCGCAEKAQPKRDAYPKLSGPRLNSKAVDARVVQAGNKFGFDLLKRIYNGDQNTNLLISPFSLSSTLAMTYNGASGATQKEMAQVLRLANVSSGVLPLPKINAANAALQFNLAKAIPHNDSRVEIEIANSLWAKKGVSFEPGFLAVNKNFYNAKITSLDLSTPVAVEAMNAWAKQNTHGKIEKIFDSAPDARARLILLNAVYFNGKWQSQFDESNTRNATFYLQYGEQKQVPMMSQEEHFAYAKHKDCATLSLPYGNGAIGLMLVLPDKNVQLESIVSRLSISQWDKWQSQMLPRLGTISLPRFKVDTEIDLEATLQSMGMKSAFSDAADFSKMRTQNDLFLSSVRQKAVIEVNEEGTEAAVVTESTTTAKSESDEPFEFVADRPFLGAIYDTNSGAILFLMIVRKP